MTAVRKTYVDGPFGQVHARLTSPVEGAQPLVCLHATAYSSQSFLPIMQAVGARRQVIAIDAPGYGESDGPSAPIAMDDYGAATLAAVEQLVDGPVAVLGYHTGCYAATEMAIARADLIDRLVLIGIPYFQALDFDLWKARLATPHRLTDRLDQFEERWSYFVTNRDAAVSLERGFANFVDELKAWPDGWWAHDAMFAYDSDARLPLVQQPVLVLNPDGHLAPASRAAGALMPRCTVKEMPTLTGPVLESASDRIGAAVEEWLAQL
ncbi:alpha/beta fold hydrolase [Sphingobium aromaticivastans]|uniref:alpha/beta fold hydrolase n=1 Tax=Sphingobium aromaticivastans TaxID=1778665 RepID=UPI0030184801